MREINNQRLVQDLPYDRFYFINITHATVDFEDKCKIGEIVKINGLEYKTITFTDTYPIFELL